MWLYLYCIQLSFMLFYFILLYCVSFVFYTMEFDTFIFPATVLYIIILYSI
nr:MAG TPA: hypothetical protein [Caudoviricetes sp.]